ncbi:MAG: hypothetical protein QG641_603 [Candidatus Poribacteria bacterium]|nr:hypothetical protein [Candidatus Poribacteria bacterium]
MNTIRERCRYIILECYPPDDPQRDDPDDILTSEEEKIVKKGFNQLKRGEFINCDN